jgi:hypothetical protein
MTLENLFKTRLLLEEPADKREFIGLVSAARDRLEDAQNQVLSFSSRFDLAYNAAHGYALAALRAKGYRTDKRYLVFQCLVHTVGLDKAKARVFSMCHERRNLAEYEGHVDVDEGLLAELINNTLELEALVNELAV